MISPYDRLYRAKRTREEVSAVHSIIYLSNSKQNALLSFHRTDGYANALQCYVTLTLPILSGVTSKRSRAE
jgi:hypothetical protein